MASRRKCRLLRSQTSPDVPGRLCYCRIILAPLLLLIPPARLANPGRDYTVATIFRVIPPGKPAPGTYEAVDVSSTTAAATSRKAPA